jgi:hypothetical protein
MRASVLHGRFERTPVRFFLMVVGQPIAKRSKSGETSSTIGAAMRPVQRNVVLAAPGAAKAQPATAGGVCRADDLTPGARAGFFGHIETSTVFGRDATMAASLARLSGGPEGTLLPVGVVAVAGVLHLRKRRGKGQRLREELWPVHVD